MTKKHKALTHLVAVYGTLRTGMHNNGYLRGATSLGLFQVPDYRLFSMSKISYNSIPFAVHVSDIPNTLQEHGVPLKDLFVGNSVTVEVFEIPEMLREVYMRHLDALEGHPAWYTRVEVMAGEHRAWMYTFQTGMAHHHLLEVGAKPIPSGDWVNPTVSMAARRVAA